MPEYEFTYTYYNKERPPTRIVALSPEDALRIFRQIKPGVPFHEISVPVLIPEVSQKTPKIPLVLTPGKALTPDEYKSLLQDLCQKGYTLHLACKPEYVDLGRAEYASWTESKEYPQGEKLPEDRIKIYENAFSREWFLIFQYSPEVSYPFPIIERGTGGGKGTPCGLHLRGRVEVCYAEVAEQLVRAGLRAA
jgi:hypothetical protein